jgi:glycine cleavage system transcriptional repressor
MRSDIVLTLTGPDRVGIVEEVTGILLGLGGNIETSRMARLGGEFAILMLLALPSERVAELEGAFAHLVEQGYKTTVDSTKPEIGVHEGWLRYRILVTGADHEGIIHEVAHGLAGRGINIESAETGTTLAPVSGTPLFFMTAEVVVPPELAGKGWEGDLQKAAALANVDIEVQPVVAG